MLKTVTLRPDGAGDAADPPPAPWDCRVRAVCAPVRRGSRPALLVVADYSATPVGPYREAFLAVLTRPWSGTVPWIVVDDVASVAGGRLLWALPKQLGSLRLAAHRGAVDAHVDDGCVRLELVARARGPALPVLAAGLLRQPGRRAAALVVTGRARLALVSLTGSLPPGVRGGTRPGLLLEGRLRIGPPGGGLRGAVCRQPRPAR
jgi:hypothetical protein